MYFKTKRTFKNPFSFSKTSNTNRLLLHLTFEDFNLVKLSTVTNEVTQRFPAHTPRTCRTSFIFSRPLELLPSVTLYKERP